MVSDIDCFTSTSSQRTPSIGSSARSRNRSVNSTAPNYLCDRQSPLITSWTVENRDRRFYGSANFRSKGSGFFRWYDEGVWERGKEVILWLKKKNNQLSEDNRWMESEIMELNREISNLKYSENHRNYRWLQVVVAEICNCWC